MPETAPNVLPPGSDSKHIDDNTILTATHKEHPFGASTDPEFNLDVHQNIPSSKLFRAYRSALFNIFLIGLIALTQTGLWTALNNVGAGGASEPWLYNAGSALTFGIMSFGCSIAGVLANKFGIKIILVIGTLGYVPWFAALYTNNRYGTEWFMLLGATLCGLSASCLWATEGAIAVSYPHTDDRAKATGLWLGLRQLGQIVGASIQLAMNIRSSNRGAVIYTVFYVFIAIACLGLPASLLVSSPHKAIRRRPGEPWTNVAPRRTTPSGKNTSWAVEFKRLWRVLKLKHMILLTMILITFDMNRVYIGIYMVQTISVRSRALTALVAGFAQVIADVFWGWFLDSKIIKSRKRRAQVCWALFSVLMFIGFAWFTYNEYNYSNQNPRPTLDWSRGGFAVGFIPPLLLYFMNEAHYIFCYYLIGSFHGDVQSATLAAGIVRSFESVGSAIAFGLGATRVSPMVNLIVAFVAFGLCVPPTAAVTFMVPEQPLDYSAVVEEADTYSARSEGAGAAEEKG